jgi:hypothetical protein
MSAHDASLPHRSCMCIFIMLTELVSAYLNGALVLRLAGRTKGGIREALLPIWTRNMLSVLFVAMALGAIRLVFIVANNIIPCSGILILPFVLKWCSVKRKRVALMDQLDMILSICLLENLNQRAAKRRAINYYIETWGENPRRRVRVDLVFALCALVLIFGAGLPCAIVGAKQKNEVLRVSLRCKRPFTLIGVACGSYISTTRPPRLPLHSCQASPSSSGRSPACSCSGPSRPTCTLRRLTCTRRRVGTTSGPVSLRLPRRLTFRRKERARELGRMARRPRWPSRRQKNLRACTKPCPNKLKLRIQLLLSIELVGSRVSDRHHRVAQCTPNSKEWCGTC